MKILNHSLFVLFILTLIGCTSKPKGVYVGDLSDGKRYGKGTVKYINGDKTRWEASPLQKIAKKKQLSAFKHNGFWKCMDTPRDRLFLEKFKKKYPWK